MQTLTEIALKHSQRPVFSREEMDCWLDGTPDSQFGLLRRAMQANEVTRIHRGLYAVSHPLAKAKPDPLVLAQRICGPSYVSLETALALHGWIPEAVYTVTSVCLTRSREVDTPIGQFSFTPVPQRNLYAGVARSTGANAERFMLASPLKALADYVYVHKCDWVSSRPLIESLRIDADYPGDISQADLKSLAENYRSRRVRRFLTGLGKELG
jgi:predicted transcriptional regulator of viral defense system